MTPSERLTIPAPSTRARPATHAPPAWRSGASRLGEGRFVAGAGARPSQPRSAIEGAAATIPATTCPDPSRPAPATPPLSLAAPMIAEPTPSSLTQRRWRSRMPPSVRRFGRHDPISVRWVRLSRRSLHRLRPGARPRHGPHDTARPRHGRSRHGPPTTRAAISGGARCGHGIHHVGGAILHRGQHRAGGVDITQSSRTAISAWLLEQQPDRPVV